MCVLHKGISSSKDTKTSGALKTNLCILRTAWHRHGKATLFFFSTLRDRYSSAQIRHQGRISGCGNIYPHTPAYCRRELEGPLMSPDHMTCLYCLVGS